MIAGYERFELRHRGLDRELYQAISAATGTAVLIKVFTIVDGPTLGRFRRNLDIAAELGRGCAQIAPVLATGTTNDGRPYLVSEPTPGSLLDVAAGQLLPVEEVVAIGLELSAALTFAHERGALHGDIKPANVLRSATGYQLAEFGLTRSLDAGRATELSQLSVRYASPQLLAGDPPTTADDIFSVAVLLFELLEGRSPFDLPFVDATDAAEGGGADDLADYVRRIQTNQQSAPARSDIPPGLAIVLSTGLASRPAERYPSAQALADGLNWVQGADSDRAGLVVSPPPIPLHRPAEGDLSLPTHSVADTPAPTPSEPPRWLPSDVDSVPDPGRSSHRSRPADPPHRRRRIGLLIAAVILIGLLIGAAPTLFRNAGNDRAVTPGPTVSTPSVPSSTIVSPSSSTPRSTGAIPTYTGTLPSTGPSGPSLPGSNTLAPELTPRLVGVRQTTGGAVLQWTDPSRGVATFVVFEVVDGTKPINLTPVQPGVLTATITAARPGRRHCFAVTALTATGHATSKSTCTS